MSHLRICLPFIVAPHEGHLHSSQHLLDGGAQIGAGEVEGSGV